MDDRREHPRMAVTIEVDFDSGHNFYTGQTRDLSIGGVFIETAIALPVGDELAVKLVLEGKRYTINTQVMWSLADAEGRSIGVGCRFLRLRPAQREAIEAFMQKRGPMDFEVEAEDDAFERPSGHPGRSKKKS